ncbi:MAG: nucleoid-associated protein [Anaerolineales bacterium]|nr:nucleoid-associated protein [Anaerolineales bacterium]
MRSMRNVKVEDAIVHILEIKEGRKVISERPVPLLNNPNLSGYFEDLIVKASEDKSARAAVFSISESIPNEPFEICAGMFGSTAVFARGSQALGETFYTMMKNDGRIGDGDLVVCRFTAETDSGRGKFLGIMKLNPIGAFRNVERGRGDAGGMYVDLEIDPFVFPKDMDVLQKVAFISQPSVEDAAPDILILDTQDPNKEVAQFFQEYLDVVLVRDTAEKTLILYRCLIQSLNDQRKALSPALDKYLGNEIYNIFTRKGSFNMFQWVDDLKKGSQKVKDAFKQALKNEFGQEKKIMLDLTLVERHLNRRTFKGQLASRFSMETAIYDDIVQSVQFVKGKPNEPEHFIVTINTSTWREEIK